jgi:hypothetical protein
MEKVFIVVEKRAYEGYTVLRVYDNFKGATEYADELTLNNDVPSIDFDVFERDVYTGGY